MRILGFVVGALLVSASVISGGCKTEAGSGAGGAGGDEEFWGSGPGSSSGSGAGGGQLCEKACAKVLECGAESCPPEYLDCSMPSPMHECRGQCVLDANCAQILSVLTQNPDPEIVACGTACGQGSASSSSASASSSSASSSSSSSASSSGAGGADAGACSTCNSILLGMTDPPCPAAQPYAEALLACACEVNCPIPCLDTCTSGSGPVSQACASCAQTYCGPALNDCIAH